MNRSIAGFDWDESNTAKCQKHGVSIAEIEHMFSGPALHVEPDVLNSASEKRFRAVGKTELGRDIFLVFTLRSFDGLTFIRPISARYMHKKELENYEEAISRLQN
jgi:uncharacterized protein